ncbi:MAG TPA: ATP-dependent DNA helicase, partial [Burkholderiales bacterium]|nr:ATP-dependent DNA helicase [Burkholderiales bacterium]
RIERTLNDGGIFIAESGTGTGKTFAYLVPALLSGKKVLISTGTRHLQDQIFHRDLPLVRSALARPVSVAMLKGRSNYLCLYRLERTEEQSQSSSDFARVRDWARFTRDGDIAEVEGVAEDSSVWPLVTSSPDNCLGARCPRYESCHVKRAREQALAADIVVVNHHLFFADLALREEGFGRLLPGVAAVIFDEAHQLPDIASIFFGSGVSSHQLVGLCRDIHVEEARNRHGGEQLLGAVRSLEKTVADFRLSFGVAPKREPLEAMDSVAAYRAARADMRTCLTTLAAALEIVAPTEEGLANCYRRAVTLLDRVTLLEEHSADQYVAWYETSVRGFQLYLTPIDIAPIFRASIEASEAAWIFTSATLAIDGSFSHFQTQLGLEQAEVGQWDSPYDFARRTLMYLPPGLPEPAAADYTRRVIDVALPVLEASRGRAFLLFTSHRALNQAAELLRGRLPYPLLVQGELPRAALLRRFRELGNAVLLGTGSFWEGVDVRGEALSCVIIDKLPFGSPDDPVLRARAAALESTGRNPFTEYQVPEAVITLKQGAGRLIRDETDRGVLVLCDPRLSMRGYGRVFLNSLPPMPRTRSFEDVRSFFSSEGIEHPLSNRLA